MSVRFAKMEFEDGKNINVQRKDNFKKSALHGHEFYEIEIIVGGSTPSEINGNPKTVSQGMVTFLTPEDFHGYSGKGSIDFCKIQFTEEFLIDNIILQSVVDRKERVYAPDEKTFSYICQLFDVLHVIDEHEINHVDIKKRIVESILILLSKTASADANLLPKNNTDMQKALIYINTHFHENPPLEEIASILHLNQRYFCTKFKEYTGKTYKDYLRVKKMRYARRLLLATELPMLEVAAQSGYETQNHFNREFKAYYGISPMEYRRNRAKNSVSGSGVKTQVNPQRKNQ